MSLLLSNFSNIRALLLCMLLLLSIPILSQTKHSSAEHSSKTVKTIESSSIPTNKINEESLIEKNNQLQLVNRSYTYIGILLITILLIASAVIYHLCKQRQTIKKQNSLLAQANATKNQFFSIIAHDLRGPVISFQNISKKIEYLNKKGKEGDVNKMLQQVDLAANNLNMLLDNLLSWSLLEENAFPYQPTSINLKILCNEIFQLYQPLAESKGVKLRQHVFSDFIVLADKNSLSTILRNLISNAIKFSNYGDEVKIFAKNKNGKVLLNIEDTGRGMTDDIKECLFELDEAKINSGTKGEGGTGLGLVLCKSFTKLNKGEIFFKSQLGKGTLFSVSLPTN